MLYLRNLGDNRANLSFMLKNYLFWPILLIIFIISSETAKAHQGRGKFWLGIYGQRNFCEKTNWLWAFNAQARFTHQLRPYESIFAEPLLGYQLGDYSIWLGYRLTQHVNNRPRYQENRLIQQLIYTSSLNETNFLLRFRLEERTRSNQKQLNVQFRQRLAIEFPLLLFCDTSKPYIHNELFITLNKTVYTPHRLVAQDRLFLGINYYLKETDWWEIGYILQYLSKTPNNPNYQLHHILSINYNFR